MTTQRTKARTPELTHLPLPSGAQDSMKYLIAAIFAAGKDGCTCDCCQLTKKLAGELSTALMKESDNGDNQNSG